MIDLWSCTMDSHFLKPVVTEKTSLLMQSNKFVFLVMSNPSNKIEFKKYFKSKFDVQISKINVLKKIGKSRRRGRITGKTVTRQKIVVTVAEEKSADKLKALF